MTPLHLINSVHLYFESHGSGFPLVLAYGLGGNTGMWAGQIEVFSRQYRLILWDPRGHGQSDSPPQPEQYGLQTSADDLREDWQAAADTRKGGTLVASLHTMPSGMKMPPHTSVCG